MTWHGPATCRLHECHEGGARLSEQTEDGLRKLLPPEDQAAYIGDAVVEIVTMGGSGGGQYVQSIQAGGRALLEREFSGVERVLKDSAFEKAFWMAVLRGSPAGSSSGSSSGVVAGGLWGAVPARRAGFEGGGYFK